MKRRLLAGALAATMALSMTACGSGGGSSDTQGSGSSDGSPTTLNLILRAGAYADVIKECLPKFEEEHNVKCEVQELSESDLYSGIALDAINQKGSYDLCMVDGSWMAEFTENGVLANLSDLGYELDDDIIPATTSICYVGDDVYLAPYYGNVTVLMLNKENVKAAGYTADTIESLDDVLAVCEKQGRRQEGLYLPRRQPEQHGSRLPADPAELRRLGHRRQQQADRQHPGIQGRHELLPQAHRYRRSTGQG